VSIDIYIDLSVCERERERERDRVTEAHLSKYM